MKFLQLKAALESVMPAELTRPQPPPELPTIPFYSPGEKRQTVVGGELLLTPVDRTAAMVVRKCPWWAHPPQISNPMPPPLTPEGAQPNIKKTKQMSISPTVQRAKHPAQVDGSQESKKKDETVFNAELAGEFIKKSTDAIEGIRTLVEQAMDARTSLDILCDYWRKDWLDFMDQSEGRLKELRMTRMAFDTETRTLMASLRDVRQFFLDKNHDQEMSRLKEFVEVCERLQKLKASGFLDTVADTLIKLS